jgi:hypothetical protein
VTVVKINGTSLAGLTTGILKNTTGTGVPSIAVAADFPTLNQNTTGSAATLTTARTIAGTSFNGSANVSLANKFIVQGTSDTGLSAAQFMGSLGTGIIKNTTSTGVFSIAIASDFPTLNQSTTGTAANITGVLGSGSMPTFTGDVTNSGLAMTVGKINGTSLAGLTTGLLKNTTATGVPSIATAGTDYVIPSGSITGNAATATALSTAGTTTTVLHGNAAGAPTYSAVALATDVTGNLPNANLASQSANTVLGSLTATTPSGLAIPSCSSVTSNLIWTSGTGFGCGGIPNATLTISTTAIAANTCTIASTINTLTGLSTTSTINITPQTDVASITGWGATGGLVIDAWPASANTMQYKVCNQTSASITPGASVTFNVSAR